ncbi:uncharacterized protein K460DRAFT_212212 [Cucurbitaria berberidis CBS 394.84]|uniref:Uncharacterized protein n=1 Tax=Cucurbitaria berberidis CBS 394.84 TaxID=1168544 RepID=A0A9P4L3L1_9PLEO|nr:uncharacterized protein K460DRAFT_212212 [Cucurbitaria berberidis CBS 394.84]KAF1839888.1 hypothetical protein K460DRAFT_212212 [Cucurbitaria berberidis CBS 394.84]
MKGGRAGGWYGWSVGGRGRRCCRADGATCRKQEPHRTNSASYTKSTQAHKLTSASFQDAGGGDGNCRAVGCVCVCVCVLSVALLLLVAAPQLVSRLWSRNLESSVASVVLIVVQTVVQTVVRIAE